MANLKPVAVVIEDDPPIRRFLRTGLSSQGFEVFEADCGQRGLVEAGQRKPDVVILDLGLPDMDGVEVVRQLREWSAVPVVILSARGSEQSKIEALDAGADDYLTKPFGLGELLARLRVVLRRAARVAGQQGGPPSGLIVTGGLEIDLLNRQVRLDGQPVRLTPIQYRLLALLAQNAGKVLTQRQILNEVWGPSHAEDAHYLRIYMSQLRQKLEADPARPQYLLTESGVGYRLNV